MLISSMLSLWKNVPCTYGRVITSAGQEAQFVELLSRNVKIPLFILVQNKSPVLAQRIGPLPVCLYQKWTNPTD